MQPKHDSSLWSDLYFFLFCKWWNNYLKFGEATNIFNNVFYFQTCICYRFQKLCNHSNVFFCWIERQRLLFNRIWFCFYVQNHSYRSSVSIQSSSGLHFVACWTKKFRPFSSVFHYPECKLLLAVSIRYKVLSYSFWKIHIHYERKRNLLRLLIFYLCQGTIMRHNLDFFVSCSRIEKADVSSYPKNAPMWSCRWVFKRTSYKADWALWFLLPCGCGIWTGRCTLADDLILLEAAKNKPAF